MVVKLPAAVDIANTENPPYHPYGLSDGSLGAFHYEDKEVEWSHCREEFQMVFPRVDRILFYTNKIKQVTAFINHVEQLLKLPKSLRAKLYKTNFDKILFIRLGSFWRKQCRRELFTILLRAGREYNSKTKNFWATCKKSSYLSRTNTAFRYFMNGNTKYCGNFFDGWVDSFSYITLTKIKKKLVKDECKSKTKSLLRKTQRKIIKEMDVLRIQEGKI